MMGTQPAKLFVPLLSYPPDLYFIQMTPTRQYCEGQDWIRHSCSTTIKLAFGWRVAFSSEYNLPPELFGLFSRYRDNIMLFCYFCTVLVVTGQILLSDVLEVKSYKSFVCGHCENVQNNNRLVFINVSVFHNFCLTFCMYEIIY